MNYLVLILIIISLGCQPSKSNTEESPSSKKDIETTHLELMDFRKVEIEYSKFNISAFTPILSIDELPKAFLHSFGYMENKKSLLANKNDKSQTGCNGAKNLPRYKMLFAGKHKNTFLAVVKIPGQYTVVSFIGFNQDSIPFLFTLDYGIIPSKYDSIDSHTKLEFAKSIAPSETKLIERLEKHIENSVKFGYSN